MINKLKVVMVMGLSIVHYQLSIIKAQNITYSHDAAKMNQITVAEIGSGGLTPALYYDLLHSSYQKTAARKNKLGLRTTASIAGYLQVNDAERLDSAMTRRATIEALNVADRMGGVADVAWMAEGGKIRKKLADLERNINRIVYCGGSMAHKRMWTDIYNLSQTGIRATQEAYMPNSQRKKQYLRIYADLCRQNETLVKFLVYLSNAKTTSSLLSASYVKDNRNAEHAAAALGRWRDAAWNVKVGDNKGSGWELVPGGGGTVNPNPGVWGDVSLDPAVSAGPNTQ